MLKDALGGYRGSLEELNKIVEKAQDNAEAYYHRANVRSNAGDSEGAIEDYTKAIEIGLRPREKLLACGNRGIARAAVADIEGAMEDFTAVIDAEPTNGGILRTALFNRSLLRRKQGNDIGADLDYQRALSITTNRYRC